MLDRTMDAGTRIWQKAFNAWYDHKQAGHRIRAAVWGWVADRLCTFA